MATMFRPTRVQSPRSRRAVRSTTDRAHLALITVDASPVTAAADRAVILWLLVCAVAVAASFTIGSRSLEWLVLSANFVSIVPFFVLLLGRKIRTEMRLRLMNLPLLAAFQLGMGWSAGASESPYHFAWLGAALVIFMVAVWTAWELARWSGHRLLVRRYARASHLDEMGIQG